MPHCSSNSAGVMVHGPCLHLFIVSCALAWVNAAHGYNFICILIVRRHTHTHPPTHTRTPHTPTPPTPTHLPTHTPYTHPPTPTHAYPPTNQPTHPHPQTHLDHQAAACRQHHPAWGGGLWAAERLACRVRVPHHAKRRVGKPRRHRERSRASSCPRTTQTNLQAGRTRTVTHSVC